MFIIYCPLFLMLSNDKRFIKLWAMKRWNLFCSQKLEQPVQKLLSIDSQTFIKQYLLKNASNYSFAQYCFTIIA